MTKAELTAVADGWFAITLKLIHKLAMSRSVDD